jgi:hypothetical protein
MVTNALTFFFTSGKQVVIGMGHYVHQVNKWLLAWAIMYKFNLSQEKEGYKWIKSENISL